MVTAADLRNSFEEWAKIAARLRGRPPAQRDKILAELGIEAIWESADAHWRTTLIDDLAAGSLKRAKRFAEVCASDLAVRDGHEPTLEPPPREPQVVVSTPSPPHYPPVAPPASLGPASLAAPPPPEGDEDFRHRATFGPPAPTESHEDQEPFEFPQGGIEDPPTQPEWEELNVTAPMGLAIKPAVKAIHWSLEKYARYSAEVRRHEHDHGALLGVFERWGMEEDIHVYVREVWAMRLEDHPDQQARFDALVKYYRDLDGDRRAEGG